MEQALLRPVKGPTFIVQNLARLHKVAKLELDKSRSSQGHRHEPRDFGQLSLRYKCPRQVEEAFQTEKSKRVKV